VAWVYDQHSDEEGCFGWVGEKLERLPQIIFVDAKGGEGAGETGKPEPLLDYEDDDSDAKTDLKTAPSEAQAALRAAISVLSYLTVLVIGFFVCWFLFPHFVLIPVDPHTGQPLMRMPYDSPGGSQSGTNPGQINSPAAQPANPTPAQQGAKGKP
jgi:hypothetical protein